MRNRKTRVNAIAAILCVLFVAGCLCIRWVNRGGNYDDAIRCLEAGDYETALEIFERLGNYRDVRQLRNYALALQSADSGSASAFILARTYISRISVSYDGALLRTDTSVPRGESCSVQIIEQCYEIGLDDADDRSSSATRGIQTI